MTWVRCDGFRGAGRILVLDPLLPLVSVVGSGGIVPRLLAGVRSARPVSVGPFTRLGPVP